MAAPFLVGIGDDVDGVAALSVPLPTQPLDPSDLLLMFVATANQPPSAPAGWTEIPNSPQGIGTAATDLGTGLSIFRAWAADVPGAVSLGDFGNFQHAIISAWRGVNPANPINATSFRTANETDILFPPLDTTVADCRVIAAATSHRDIRSSDTQFVDGSEQAGTLDSLTEIFDEAVDSGLGGALAIFHGIKSAAGTASGIYVNIASSPLYNSAQIVVALAPASGAVALAVGSSAHAHGAGSPALAARSTIAVNSALNAQSCTSPDLNASGIAALSPVGASHGHVASSPNLAARTLINSANARHGHSAGPVGIVYRLSSAANDSGHGHAASIPSLSAWSTVGIDSAGHAHLAGGMTPRAIGWNEIAAASGAWIPPSAAAGTWTPKAAAAGSWS